MGFGVSALMVARCEVQDFVDRLQSLQMLRVALSHDVG